MARFPTPSLNGKPVVRCAIYTRKSTEEGLEQEYNSLDAQRDACAAYILSQRHEGWTQVAGLYDDGGYSGGTMERPGLKQLLADVALGRVDVIVVYKVDRLTRSLSDFSKIVDVLEKAGASFVSVTQAFNTTTSMGRLMLNVLLSFAQFEREVTGERIRDKVAASKRKGIWMGGNVPLGYDVRERKLIVNEAEAATVRLIFERYLALRSINALAGELRKLGIVSKRRGASHGGVPLTVGPLSHMLKNPIYLGKIRHKEELFAGEHAAILEVDLFDRVQLHLADQRNNHGARWSSENTSVLVGRLTDHAGRRMAPTHATKGQRRYRYYVSRGLAEHKTPVDGWRVPAAELENAVRSTLADWIGTQAANQLAAHDPHALFDIGEAAADMARRIETAAAGELRALLSQLDAQVVLQPTSLSLQINADALAGLLGRAEMDALGPLCIEVAIAMPRRGCELRLVSKPQGGEPSARVDASLVQLIARAEQAHRQLIDQVPVDRTKRGGLVRLARLRTLAPDIVTAILGGQQPASLTSRRLLRMPSLPMAWDDQRRVLGFE